MGKFLKENWAWIAGPIFLVMLIVFILLMFTSNDDPAAPFSYNLR